MVRFRPFQNVGLHQLRGEVDRIMDECLAGRVPGFQATGPATDVAERDQALVVEMDLPGYRHEDLDISVIGSELTIKGHRPEPVTEGVNYLRRERTAAEFARTIHLPVEVNVEGVTADLDQGVLRITLPKAQSVVPRKIEIRTA